MVDVGDTRVMYICRSRPSVSFQSYYNVRVYQFSISLHDIRPVFVNWRDWSVAGAIFGLHTQLIPILGKRTENDNNGSPPGRYHRAEPAARRLSPHWKSSTLYLCTLQDAAKRYFVSMNAKECVCIGRRK